MKWLLLGLGRNKRDTRMGLLRAYVVGFVVHFLFFKNKIKIVAIFSRQNFKF